MTNSLRSHGLQHARLLCPSLSPRVCSNSCSLSQWCHPTISSYVTPFSSWIYPSIRVFSNELVLCIRWPKYWSFSFNIRPSSEYSGLISFDLLAGSSRDSQESSPSLQFESINSLVALSLLYGPALTSVHDYFKNHSFDYTDFVGKGMSLLFNMLSRLVISFLPRSKCLLILWLQSPSTVILEPKKIKSVTVSTFSLSISHEVMNVHFLNVEF